MNKLTSNWIDKAEKDFLVAIKEIKSVNPVYDAICFHSQQCVEKYLKAVLQENNIYFEKTHDLGSLASQCKQFISISKEVMIKLEYLSEYAVEIRYPGVDATEEEARVSFQVCEEMRKLVRNYFGLEVVE